jgi:hypothetical protein
MVGVENIQRLLDKTLASVTVGSVRASNKVCLKIQLIRPLRKACWWSTERLQQIGNTLHRHDQKSFFRALTARGAAELGLANG